MLFYHCSKTFTNAVLSLMVNLIIFRLVFCVLFKSGFIAVGIGSKITGGFLFAFRSTCKGCLQHLLSRVRSGNLFSASLCTCENACNPSPSSTMTRDFCVVLVYSNEQASIWSSKGRSESDNGRNQTAAFFSSQQLQFARLRWICRDWWHQACPPLHTRKRDVTCLNQRTT